MKILVIINNHLTNIFFYAFYLSNKKKYSNYTFHFIIDNDIYTYDKKNDDKLILKFINKFPNKINKRNININKNYNKIHFNNFYNFYRNYKNNINTVKKNKLMVNSILKESFSEIWIGNSALYDYLGSGNVINKFEHGIGDLPIFLKKKNIIRLLKLKIENIINKYLLSIEIYKKNTFWTILKSRKVNYQKNIKIISNKYLNKSLNILSIRKKFVSNNILILYPFDRTIKFHEKTIHQKYFEYCQDKLQKLKTYKSITTIYIKAKYENSENIKKLILILKKKINKKIILLNIKTYKNIEYYLISMSPKIILSNLNLGIYLFKYIKKKKFIFINTDNIFDKLSRIGELSSKKIKYLNTWKKNMGTVSKLFLK